MLLVPNAPVRVLHRWVTVPSGSTRHTLASVVSVHTACAVAIRAGGVLVGAVGTVVPGVPAFYVVRDLPRSLW